MEVSGEASKPSFLTKPHRISAGGQPCGQHSSCWAAGGWAGSQEGAGLRQGVSSQVCQWRFMVLGVAGARLGIGAGLELRGWR